MTLRILLADDCPAFRRAARALLERNGYEIVAEVGEGYEAIGAAARWMPDVAVLDLSMPGPDGIDGARAIATAGLSTRVVLLTSHAQEHLVVRALRAGVHGYVLKAEAAEHLGDAVRVVASGRIFLSPSARRAAEGFVVETDGVLAIKS
jgi:DNA-binding NarL/FixJ family response regulator